MAKQLNVALNFTANTAQAEANLKSLQQTLNSISAINTSGMSIDAPIRKAISSAKELQQHLMNAYDANTGNINLNKFLIVQ